MHGASKDGQVVAIPNAGGNGAFVLHRADHRVVRLAPHYDVRSCAVSPDGGLVATGRHWESKDPGARVWDAQTGKLVRDLPVASGAVQFSPDGKWLLTSNGSRIWSVGTWKEGPALGTPALTWAAFSADSSLLALTDVPGVVRLVRPESGREVARLSAPVQSRLHPYCFTPDGTRLVCQGVETESLHIFRLDLIRRQLAELATTHLVGRG